jgi:hypothetical protein
MIQREVAHSEHVTVIAPAFYSFRIRRFHEWDHVNPPVFWDVLTCEPWTQQQKTLFTLNFTKHEKCF